MRFESIMIFKPEEQSTTKQWYNDIDWKSETFDGILLFSTNALYFFFFIIAMASLTSYSKL